jgi:hypothetical protein
MSQFKHCQRMFEDLSSKEQAILAAIQKPEDIKTIEPSDTWTDDHIVCCGAAINGVEIGFWHCGAEMAGFLECDDSLKAKGHIVKAIKKMIREDERDTKGYLLSGLSNILSEELGRPLKAEEHEVLSEEVFGFNIWE